MPKEDPLVYTVPSIRGNSFPNVNNNNQLVDVSVKTGSPRRPLVTALESEAESDDLLRSILYRLENPLPPVSNLPMIKTLFGSVQRPADTNAYTANDAFSDSTTSPVQGGYFLRLPQGIVRGRVRDGVVVMSAATVLQGELWLFDAPVTNIADNVAFDVKDDVIREHLVGVVPFNCTDTTSSNSISYVNGLDFDFENLNGGLWFLVKVMNAPTPASAEVLSTRLHIEV